MSNPSHRTTGHHDTEVGDDARRADLDQALQQILVLEDQLKRMQRHRTEQERTFRRTLERMGREVQNRQDAIDSVKASVSWRMTAPVRAALAVARKRKGQPSTPDTKPKPQIAHQRIGSTKDYAAWLRLFPQVPDQDVDNLRQIAAELAESGPTISVLMPVYNPDLDHLRDAVTSVKEQLYPGWQLCIADDASTDDEVRSTLRELADQDPRIVVVEREENGHISRATNSALAVATGEYVAFLDQDDALVPEALTVVAFALREHPAAGLVYSDEDKIDEASRPGTPYHKPPFNHALLLAQNTVCHLAVLRRDLVTRLGGLRPEFDGAQDYDLVLRAVEHLDPAQIHRIPRVLYHWRASSGSTSADAEAKPYARSASRRAVEEHLARTGKTAVVTDSPSGVFNRPGPHRDAPHPSVSIIIPTKDRLVDLQRCIDSIRDLSTYDAYELIVVDNGSTAPDAIAYLEQAGRHDNTRIIHDPRPFNYSRMNNDAVDAADGEFVLLLNNDTEIITRDWIEQMLFWFQWDDVGTVGAKLLYPDGCVQHGGIILGIGGVAGHAQKYADGDDPGYYGRLESAVDVDGNTGACMLVRRRTYRELGGLDEDRLAVAFNDVDFCIRVGEAGLRNVWTPAALLIHHESATRGSDHETLEKWRRAQREADHMRWRWQDRLVEDRCYNPNLTIAHEDFTLAVPPRIPGVLVEERARRIR